MNTKHSEILSLLAKGLSIEEVAKKVGATKQYVYVVRWKDDRAKGRTLRNNRGTPKAKAKAKPKKVVRLQKLTKSTIKELIEAEQAIRDQIPALAAKLDEDKAKAKARADMVNSPSHYTAGGIEVYDYIAAKGLSYELGNVVKYVSRADYKGNKLQDLQKARWYLDAAIRTAGGAV